MSKKDFHILLALAIIGLFVFQAVMQFNLAKKDGQTIDEAVHIAAGYTYLTRGDYRFNPEHPPLVKYFIGFPLLFNRPHNLVSDKDWASANHYYLDAYYQASGFGHQLLYLGDNNADQLLFRARIGPIILTLLLGLLICLIAICLWGWWAGLVAYALYVFDPMIAGHGHLATTDIGASIGYLISIVGLWYLIRKPSVKSAIIFGMCFAIAQLMKFTLLMLVPFVLGVMIYVIWKNKPDQEGGEQTKVCTPVGSETTIHRASSRLKSVLKRYYGSHARIIGLFLLSAITSVIIIWAGYGFHRSTLPFDTGSNETGQIINQPSNGALRQMYNYPKMFSWIPLPYDYIRGAAMVLNHTGGGHPSFLLGQNSSTGWKYYFPFLMLVKTPIITLFLLIISLALLIKKKLIKDFPTFLIIGALWYLLVAIISPANLGIRHIMPIYSLLFLLVGYAISKVSNKIRIIVLLLLIILGGEFAYNYPFYLSYFNQFVGGSYNGYKIATDSNLDWGGDLKYIKTYTDSHAEINYYVMYNWDSEEALNYYHIKRRPTAEIKANPIGTLIIGASILQSPEWQWVKDHKLIDQITPGVLVYNLDSLK